MSRKTLTVGRVALALVALVAISFCRGRTGPDPQEFVARRLTDLQVAAGNGAPERALEGESRKSERPPQER